MTETQPRPPRRWLAILGLVISVALLIPGLIEPVISVRGTLDPAGIGQLAPQLLDQGLTDTTLTALRPMLNPAILPFLDATPGGLKGALVTLLGAQIGSQLKSGEPIEVYQQTRSILGSVQHLYQVGSWLVASLILLFSVLVPFTKASLVMWAVLRRDDVIRHRTLHLVELIAKWSMADVFAVALFITYLAAAASQTAPGATAGSLVNFTATFGPGFYWFTAYCIVSLAVQQATARWIMTEKGGRRKEEGER